MVLKDVCHVSDIMLNLISTGWLDDEGYNGSFQKKNLEILHGELDCGLSQEAKFTIVRRPGRHNRRVVAQEVVPYESKEDADVGW